MKSVVDVLRVGVLLFLFATAWSFFDPPSWLEHGEPLARWVGPSALVGAGLLWVYAKVGGRRAA